MKYILFIVLFHFFGVDRNTDTQTVKFLSGRAVKIADGDTFTLLTDDRKQYKIRLNGIDAPEKGQDFYQVSKDHLGTLLSKNIIHIRFTGKDKYGRLLGDVYVGKTNWVNQQMVLAGLAWHFKKYSSDSSLAAAENIARQKKAGLWKLPSPTAPWIFRSDRRIKH